MQMGRAGIAGGPHQTEALAAQHPRTGLHRHGAEMAVEGLPAIGVGQQHGEAIAAHLLGQQHETLLGRQHGGPLRHQQVHAGVHAPALAGLRPAPAPGVLLLGLEGERVEPATARSQQGRRGQAGAEVGDGHRPRHRQGLDQRAGRRFGGAGLGQARLGPGHRRCRRTPGRRDSRRGRHDQRPLLRQRRGPQRQHAGSKTQQQGCGQGPTDGRSPERRAGDRRGW